MSEAVLAMVDVQAGYGGGLVLQGLDLQIDKGTITCIVGPNGAGKSTVFRVISGLIKPKSGTVTFLGKDITGAISERGPASRRCSGPAESSALP